MTLRTKRNVWDTTELIIDGALLALIGGMAVFSFVLGVSILLEKVMG